MTEWWQFAITGAIVAAVVIPLDRWLDRGDD